MEHFRPYSPEDIILSNLDECAKRHFHLFEQEIAHLSELAKELIENRAEASDAISSIPEFHLSEHPLPECDATSPHKHLNKQISDIHIAEKQILLSEEIRKRLSIDPTRPPSEFFRDAEKDVIGTEQNVVYQKNSFADTAYLQFASLLNAPRAVYTHSFLSACEDVYNGSCEYCILPLENTSEGLLVGFAKLIERFGLKIVATCDIFGNEGARLTRFALLRKNILPLPKQSTLQNCFLEISVPFENPQTPNNLLIAAGLCNLPLSRIHSLPYTEEHEPSRYHAAFQISEQSLLSTFLIYLTMEIPQYTLTGIYPHIPYQSKK